MILIFGGAYQGKREFAMESLHIPEDDILDLSNAETIEELMESGENPESWVSKNRDFLKAKAVIIRDISQGLVPMEERDRAYRELNSKLMVAVAGEADEVYRVFCGIGTKIK